MKLLIIYMLGCGLMASAMESPAPTNRYFLRDLMQAYKEKKPLDLASKSPATITDIKNWIAYARNNEKARAELAREFSSTSEEIGFVLDILDAEIQNSGRAPVKSPQPTPVVAPIPLVPKVKPAPAIARPQLALSEPMAPVARASAPSVIDSLVQKLEAAKAIQHKQDNVIQVKTVDQFKLGDDMGPATCPVQALRNVITLLQFSYTGIARVLDQLSNVPDARKFLELVGKCGVGTQWLTAEEIGRILSKLENVSDAYRKQISSLDTVQEINLYPEQLKALQEQFKQQNAAHGFILGTMDVGQTTGERGHYFAFVLKKVGPEYLYLIADTAPTRNHLDTTSYDYKRVKYLVDMITKGKSDININEELQKITDVKYQDMMARALTCGAGFDFKSLNKNELEGFERIAATVDHNKNEWKNRTRLNDKQLADNLAIIKQRVQEQLRSSKRP